MKKVYILDFGSQYTQLIARRFRDMGYYSEILPFNAPIPDDAGAIVLSGSPYSVYDKNAPLPDRTIFSRGIPVLGICYGLQVITHMLGGRVSPSSRKEYGPSVLEILEQDHLFKSLPDRIKVWMSHGDRVDKIPDGFRVLAKTEGSHYAAIFSESLKVFGVQFHPEVVHTERGSKMLENFAEYSGLRKEWTTENIVEKIVDEIKERVGNERVILALSGGVDSTVLGKILEIAIPEQTYFVFVDTGLMRHDDNDRISRLFPKVNIIEAEDKFLRALQGITNPEEKRRVVGRLFVEVFENFAKTLKPRPRFLAQGTLYPDVIESTSVVGPSAKIKTHHNVGGLPEKLNFELIEPFRFLFKDELRRIGKFMGLEDEIIYRHPFPGPGLAVRIIGEITRDRIRKVRAADRIIEEEIKKGGMYKDVWQSFAVLIPVKTVGVQGDYRTEGEVIAVRVVESVDGMTAHWVKLPYEIMERISERITGEVPGINRVVYDITSKPPATIEWE